MGEPSGTPGAGDPTAGRGLRVGSRRGSDDRRTLVVDRVMAGLVRTGALAVTVVFGWIFWEIAVNGLSSLDWSYLTGSVLDAGRAGGIGPILVSTGLILAVCLTVSVPVGLGAAIFLAEFTARSAMGGAVRRSLDLLAGVPSIVFGLFGNVFFSQVLGMGFSILSGGLTLSLMVLPILIRTTEEGLRSVSDETRYGAAALSLSRSTTLFRLLMPQAVPGLAVGLVLGIGRALAETAALLFTSGYVARMPTSLLDSGRSLSIHIYDLSMNVAGGEGRAYSAALVLMLLLLVSNVTASGIARRYQRRRVTAA